MQRELYRQMLLSVFVMPREFMFPAACTVFAQMAHWVEISWVLTISNRCHHQQQTSKGPLKHCHGDMLSANGAEELSCSLNPASQGVT